MNVVLIGLRGSGKTCCGRLLAQRLGWEFLDTDVLVQERAQKTIQALFAEEGEDVFRLLEAEVVKQVTRRDRSVIATGGGVVLDPENVTDLRENGLVVHLEASPAALWPRIQNDAATTAQRPALIAGQASGLAELEILHQQRAEAYAAARHLSVSVAERTVAETVDELERLVRARLQV